MTKEKKYVLTFKGLLSTQLDEEGTTKLLDMLELHMRRFDYNAIVLEDGFHFYKLEREK